MNLKRAPHRESARLELLDAIMERYLSWHDETRAVAESYRVWSVAVGRERGVAFERYVAALDREEHAACGYRRSLASAHAACEPRASTG